MIDGNGDGDGDESERRLRRDEGRGKVGAKEELLCCIRLGWRTGSEYSIAALWSGGVVCINTKSVRPAIVAQPHSRGMACHWPASNGDSTGRER